MIKTLIIEKGQKPTAVQLKEVENAAKYPIEFDEACEEITPEMIKSVRSGTGHRNRRKNA